MQNLSKTVFFSIFALIMFSACDSNNDSDIDNVPILLENYYFKGTIDGEVLNMEKEIYDLIEFNDPNAYSIDFGGSQTNDIEVFGEPGTGFCYGRYACGLGFYSFQENPDQLDTAKMYLSKIPVGDCNLENELTGMNDFFELNAFTYDRFPSNNILNNVAFDFFPNEFTNQEVYYSSRFGDNSDASFEITSTTGIEDDFFIVKGNFSCKLYSNNDETDFKNLENGEFKIKIIKNIED